MWEGLTMEVLQRPGGELATRPIHFFWVVDCSGSMYGEKIGIVNNTIQECIPEMRSAADNNPNAQPYHAMPKYGKATSYPFQTSAKCLQNALKKPPFIKHCLSDI